MLGSIMSKKKYLIITAVVAAGVLGVGALFFTGVFKNFQSTPLQNVFTKKATVELKTTYKNPFEKETQYVNPFEKQKNPFVTNR